MRERPATIGNATPRGASVQSFRVIAPSSARGQQAQPSNVRIGTPLATPRATPTPSGGTPMAVSRATPTPVGTPLAATRVIPPSSGTPLAATRVTLTPSGTPLAATRVIPPSSNTPWTSGTPVAATRVTLAPSTAQVTSSGSAAPSSSSSTSGPARLTGSSTVPTPGRTPAVANGYPSSHLGRSALAPTLASARNERQEAAAMRRKPANTSVGPDVSVLPGGSERSRENPVVTRAEPKLALDKSGKASASNAVRTPILKTAPERVKRLASRPDGKTGSLASAGVPARFQIATGCCTPNTGRGTVRQEKSEARSMKEGPTNDSACDNSTESPSASVEESPFSAEQITLPTEATDGPSEEVFGSSADADTKPPQTAQSLEAESVHDTDAEGTCSPPAEVCDEPTESISPRRGDKIAAGKPQLSARVVAAKEPASVKPRLSGGRVNEPTASGFHHGKTQTRTTTRTVLSARMQNPAIPVWKQACALHERLQMHLPVGHSQTSPACGYGASSVPATPAPPLARKVAECSVRASPSVALRSESPQCSPRCRSPLLYAVSSAHASPRLSPPARTQSPTELASSSSSPASPTPGSSTADALRAACRPPLSPALVPWVGMRSVPCPGSLPGSASLLVKTSVCAVGSSVSVAADPARELSPFARPGCDIGRVLIKPPPCAARILVAPPTVAATTTGAYSPPGSPRRGPSPTRSVGTPQVVMPPGAGIRQASLPLGGGTCFQLPGSANSACLSTCSVNSGRDAHSNPPSRVPLHSVSRLTSAPPSLTSSAAPTPTTPSFLLSHAACLAGVNKQFGGPNADSSAHNLWAAQQSPFAWGSPLLVPESHAAAFTPRPSAPAVHYATSPIVTPRASAAEEATVGRLSKDGAASPIMCRRDCAVALANPMQAEDIASARSKAGDESHAHPEADQAACVEPSPVDAKKRLPSALMRLQMNDKSPRYGQDGRLQVKQCADGLTSRNCEYSL